MDLYAATIPQFRQIVGSTIDLIGKAEAFCAERGIAPAELIEARLAPDMLPFAYQVKSVAAHSAGAVAGVQAGVYAPDMSASPTRFDAMRALLEEARTALDGVDPASWNALADRDMTFRFKEHSIPFAGAAGFLFSFALPNFHFHASMAYALLRAKGVPLGKRDYLGAMQIAQPAG